MKKCCKREACCPFRYNSVTDPKQCWYTIHIQGLRMHFRKIRFEFRLLTLRSNYTVLSPNWFESLSKLETSTAQQKAWATFGQISLRNFPAEFQKQAEVLRCYATSNDLQRALLTIVCLHMVRVSKIIIAFCFLLRCAMNLEGNALSPITPRL